MKIKRKKMLATISSAAVISAAAVGTMAYFTDLDAVANTFTVGRVAIELDEKDVDGSKTYVTTEGRDRANQYHLIPGETYEKDPTIHVSEDSEDCWLFVKIENGIEGIIEKEDFEKQLSDNGWTQLIVDSNVVADVYTREKYERGSVRDIKVFNSFTVNGTKVESSANGKNVTEGHFDLEDYKDKSINVTAYAIQADGFETAAEAWKAEFAK